MKILLEKKINLISIGEGAHNEEHNWSIHNFSLNQYAVNIIYVQLILQITTYVKYAKLPS